MSEVFKALELPDQEFATKEEMLCAVHDNQVKLIAIKRATLKSTDSIELTGVRDMLATKGIKVEDGFIYAVINTTKYMDSHSDVHLNGIWNKSVDQQQGKILYVADHTITLKTIIAYKENVEMMLKEVSWKDLGADFEGNTQALIFKVKHEDIEMDEARKVIEKKIAIQHSVRMQYVDFSLAMDSGNPDHAEAKANWDNTIGLVANKEKAIKQGYYWTVPEAKIFREGSMLVAGSNDITPMLLSSKEIEPSLDTHKTKPPLGTSKDKPVNIGHINF